MKNYLKPYTACTKVESEGYLLAGTGSAGNGGFTSGGGNQGGGNQGGENKGGGGCNDCDNTKNHTKSAPSSVTNGFFFSSGGE
ncbi:hypothetical protein [Prevotella melaninogenica]|uniref:hypothetical protein n=1 Tax=Prevotella melaninogenica TaxID=28132 RepID=UPI0002EC668E|nr:hypothetical protein [Prevotella melaninogenica]UEB09341.1 hypothetical protein LK441_08495 [Prevotella melaninogenica]